MAGELWSFLFAARLNNVWRRQVSAFRLLLHLLSMRFLLFLDSIIYSFICCFCFLFHSTSDAFGRVVVCTAVQFGISPLRHPMPFAANSCNYSLIRAGNWELQSRCRYCDSAVRVCCDCENTYQTTGPCPRTYLNTYIQTHCCLRSLFVGNSLGFVCNFAGNQKCLILIVECTCYRCIKKLIILFDGTV